MLHLFRLPATLEYGGALQVPHLVPANPHAIKDVTPFALEGPVAIPPANALVVSNGRPLVQMLPFAKSDGVSPRTLFRDFMRVLLEGGVEPGGRAWLDVRDEQSGEFVAYGSTCYFDYTGYAEETLVLSSDAQGDEGPTLVTAFYGRIGLGNESGYTLSLLRGGRELTLATPQRSRSIVSDQLRVSGSLVLDVASAKLPEVLEKVTAHFSIGPNEVRYPDSPRRPVSILDSIGTHLRVAVYNGAPGIAQIIVKGLSPYSSELAREAWHAGLAHFCA